MKIVTVPTVAGLLCLAFALPGFAQAVKTAATSADAAQIARGEYLVKDVAGCPHCHTPENDKGELVPGRWLEGTKLSFAPLTPFPAWSPISPGIAGLPGWDTEKAVQLLMMGLDPSGHRPRPPMPQFRMNRADATAVVAYLKSLK